MLTGGGTGGHITPVLAIASELKKLRPDVRLVYVGQKGGKLADLPASHPAIDAVYAVRAGKFRRYHGEGWRQVFDLATQAQNACDAVLTLVGLWQSYWLVKRLKPSVIFTRGGYVSVPVALGGKLAGVPYITHDSDSTPSLANRVIARWAAIHAVALPVEDYPYPKAKTISVGVPVAGEYRPVTTKLQQQYREELHLSDYRQVLLVTGGGNGAAWLNDAVTQQVPWLLKQYPRLAVVHVAGREHEQHTQDWYDRTIGVADRKRVIVKSFTSELYKFSGAADVIITRSGASSLAEFAIQGKACIVIPAEQLIWQVRHAKVLAKHGAVYLLGEAEAGHDHRLAQAVSSLFDNESARQELAANLSKLSHPDAARRLATVILDQAQPGHSQKVSS